jgi:hypothetical protein
MEPIEPESSRTSESTVVSIPGLSGGVNQVKISKRSPNRDDDSDDEESDNQGYFD